MPNTILFTRFSVGPLATFALVAALGATACKSEVIGGGGGEGGEGGSGGGSHAGGAAGSVVGSVAEYASMMTGLPPGGGTGTGGASSSSGGPGLDPNTLFVKIGNDGPACGDTFPYDCNPGITWQVSIGLPPAMQVPGVYSLDDPAIIATEAESGSDPGNFGEPAACWGGGGSFTEGTIEVVSNDGATLVVRLQGTSGWVEFNADGQYAAPICQWGLD